MNASNGSTTKKLTFVGKDDQKVGCIPSAACLDFLHWYNPRYPAEGYLEPSFLDNLGSHMMSDSRYICTIFRPLPPILTILVPHIPIDCHKSHISRVFPSMGEDTSPEIPIPMPEPPLPGPETPLVAWFPFGVVAHFLFATTDALIETKFWPSCYDEDPKLWHWFPFGVPAQLVISFLDIVYTIVVKAI